MLAIMLMTKEDDVARHQMVGVPSNTELATSTAVVVGYRTDHGFWGRQLRHLTSFAN
jgi:hypothetical protein